MQICKNFAPIKTHILPHEPLRVESNTLIMLELRCWYEKYLHKMGKWAFDYLKKSLHGKMPCKQSNGSKMWHETLTLSPKRRKGMEEIIF